MKCAACGYDKEVAMHQAKEAEGAFSGKSLELIRSYVRPWIELTVVERGPFFAGTPDVWPTGGSVPAIKRGTQTKILACPQCGTVRIEI